MKATIFKNNFFPSPDKRILCVYFIHCNLSKTTKPDKDQWCIKIYKYYDNKEKLHNT